MDAGPTYCPVHQHYKWCDHNGGVLGADGYGPPGTVSAADSVVGEGYQLAPRPWVQDGEALVTWLRAQFDEDERIARACGDVSWVDDVPGMVHVDPAAIRDNKWAFGHLGYVAGADPSELGNAYRAHIARHDPARELREVQAKRRMVELHESVPVAPGRPETTCAECGMGFDAPCPTLRLLALPFSDRPGYREEWKP